MATRTFKVVLVGDAETGKTTYVQRFIEGTYQKEYKQTFFGVEIRPLSLLVKHGNIYERIHLSLWDTAGQENLGGLRDGYYIQADAALVFADSFNPENTRTWIRNLRRVAGDELPISLVISKSDHKGFHRQTKKVFPRLYRIAKDAKGTVHEVSTRANLNIGKPLEDLLGALFREKCSILEDEPTLPPVTAVPMY